MVNVSSASARPVIEPVDLSPPPEAAVVVFSQAVESAILESSLPTLSYSRFSIFAADPVDEFVHYPDCSGEPFYSLARRVAGYPRITIPDINLPFVGGWIGYFTYEAGLSIEGVKCTTNDDVGLPAAQFRLYDSAAIYDHQERQWYLTAIDWPVGVGRSCAPVARRLAVLRDRLTRAADLDTRPPRSRPSPDPPRANMSQDTYLARVARAKRYIEAGDIYQVNFTQRFTAQTDVSPLELYLRLRRSSPSSHAAFLPWGSAVILCASPELFLELRDGHVVTRPIKGTRPRTGDSAVDATYRRELAESEKERAELNMIVDLLRNDLGRVCSFGSVQVTSPGDIEEHPTVFHRVATIEGDLRPRCGWLELLLAAFPGGSITGAPKIRAMQIIDELEPTGRGVYCGSIGTIGLDGSLSLNIAIRTMVQTGPRVHVHAGGAIVADSVPEQEYEETIAKATGMFRALACGPPAPSPIRETVTIR